MFSFLFLLCSLAFSVGHYQSMDGEFLVEESSPPIPEDTLVKLKTLEHPSYSLDSHRVDKDIPNKIGAGFLVVGAGSLSLGLMVYLLSAGDRESSTPLSNFGLLSVGIGGGILLATSIWPNYKVSSPGLGFHDTRVVYLSVSGSKIEVGFEF